MARDWIKWVKGLSKRREVMVLARKLGISRREAACACMEMWEWADDETTDGHIRGATRDDLDSTLGLPGFAVALEAPEVEWLRVTDRGLTFPRWERNNGESAKKRALESHKKSRQRDLEKKSVSRELRDKRPCGKRPREEPEEDSGSTNSQSPERFRSGSGRRRTGKIPGDLTPEVLADPIAFGHWVNRERVLPHGLIKSEDDVALAAAARQKALTDETLDTPIGWLKDTLRNRDWSRVRQAHEEAAEASKRGPAIDTSNVLRKAE